MIAFDRSGCACAATPDSPDPTAEIPDSMITTCFVIGAYLLGAVPFGLLIGWSRGIDIRQHGSRNIGATNVGRVVGSAYGKVCLVLDILKGLLPTIAARWLIVSNDQDPLQLLQWLAVALAAVSGHVFPIYLGFRGGKGVATTIGAGLGIFPVFTLSMGAGLLAYFFARSISGLVSLGSLALAFVFPLSVFLYVWRDPALSMANNWPLVAAAILLGGIIVVRHRANIDRLLRGEELPAPQSSEIAGAENPVPRK